MPLSLEERFQKLFSGLSRAYGTYTVTSSKENKKKVGTAKMYRAEVTPYVWRLHLEGRQQCAIIPINDDNKCHFGCIDIDVYDGLDYKQIVQSIAQHKLKLFPCRSKSGGLHLYVFFSQWIDADIVQSKLKTIAPMLGFGNAEIFPKQTKILASRGDIGSCINMPYFHRESTETYCLGPDCSQLPSTRFLDLAEKNRYSKEEFSHIELEYGEIIKDGPPCLQILCGQGFPKGTRNNGLFNIGVYLRKSKPDDWQTEIEIYNHKYFSPPLGTAEIQEIVKSVRKKNYCYTCSRPPISPHCNTGICKSRRFGIGSSHQLPALHSLTKFNTDPPIWFLDVDGGGRLELSSEDLQNQRRFQKRCIDCLNIMPSKMKENEWSDLINRLLGEVIVLEAPPDASISGQLIEHVLNFITGKVQGKDKADLLRGKPWYDEKANWHYFRMSDVMAYLDRHNFKDYKVHKVTSQLKRIGAEHYFMNINGRGVNVWKYRQMDPIKEEERTELPNGKAPF